MKLWQMFGKCWQKMKGKEKRTECSDNAKLLIMYDLFWWSWRGSNSWPPDCQLSSDPLESTIYAVLATIFRILPPFSTQIGKQIGKQSASIKNIDSRSLPDAHITTIQKLKSSVSEKSLFIKIHLIIDSPCTGCRPIICGAQLWWQGCEYLLFSYLVLSPPFPVSRCGTSMCRFK